MIKNRKSHGFTGVEMLVVLAAVSVTSAVMMPTFSRARENARRSSCQMNQKQIGLGFLMYSQDYDEKFPRAGTTTAKSNNGWTAALFPYLKSVELFSCPSDTHHQTGGSVATMRTDYYYNRRLSALPLSSIEATALTIMHGEGAESPGNYNCASLSACYAGAKWTTVPLAAKTRHLDGANYAFVDGHVKWMTPDRIGAISLSGATYSFSIK